MIINKSYIGDIINSKEKIICCIAVIIGVAVICSVVALNQPEETQVKFLSNSSLYNGDDIVVQLTTENGTPVANQSVNVTLIDANGGRNVQNLVTDGEGKASFTLGGVTVGNYTLECVFGGSDGYKPSNCTSKLEIKEEIKETTQQYSSNYYYSDPHSDWVCEGDTWYSKKIGEGSYALYDKSSGRMIGTGDMPDRHGYHGEEYVQRESSTVKYRSNGEYYSG